MPGQKKSKTKRNRESRLPYSTQSASSENLPSLLTSVSKRARAFLFFLSTIPFVQAMTLAASGDEVAQEAAAECFCSAASFDAGRALLGPVVESGVIFALMESKSQAARSAAAR